MSHQKDSDILRAMLPAAVGHQTELHRVVNMRWQYPKEGAHYHQGAVGAKGHLHGVGHRTEPHRVVNMRWQHPKEGAHHHQSVKTLTYCHVCMQCAHPMEGVLLDQVAAGALVCLQLRGAHGDCCSGIIQCWGHPCHPQLAVTLQG